MQNPNSWNNLKDGLSKQHKNIQELIDFLYINNIKYADFVYFGENKSFIFKWESRIVEDIKIYTKMIFVEFLDNGKISCYSQDGKIYNDKYFIEHVPDFIYYDLVHNFSEDL